MKTTRLLLLAIAVVMMQTMTAADVFDQQQAYERLYSLLQVSYDESGEVGVQYSSLDIVRNMVVLNDESADQIFCWWSDSGLPDINRNIFKSDQPQVADTWSILFYGINCCNYFLENANGTDDATLQQRAEARFLRAYFYSIALDLWGGVPLYTTSDKSQRKARNTGTEVFEFIVGELTDCMTALPVSSATVYGKPGQKAALLLLARMYLNAETYTGTARWLEAKQQAKQLIDSGDYSLCSDYALLFMGDNDTNSAEREIIWPLVVDGANQSNWGNTTFLIASTRDNNMPSCGLNQYWAGQVVRRCLLQKFFPNDNCPSTSTTDIQQAAGDDRCLFYGVNRPYGSAPFNSFNEGFSCVKYTNICSDGSVKVSDGSHADTDFPLLRYAEAYLILAEADARLNGGTCSSDGLQALNTLRQRAHATQLKSANLETLADEWAREFYLEGRRRSDLIRFGLYNGNQYMWDGKGAMVHDLLPIPDYELLRNPYCLQNPGYEDNGKKPEGLSMNQPAFAAETVDLRKVQGLWFSWQRPTNFDAGEPITYFVELSANAGFRGSVAYIKAENVEKVLFDASYLYDYLGGVGIADGENVNMYARVECHGVTSSIVSFTVCRSKLALVPHTWYILGSPIGDGGWNNSINGLGPSCVPLGVIDENTFRFSGYFNSTGFKMIRTLGNWDEQISSYFEDINNYVFNEGLDNLRFDTPGNYTLTVHYDGVYNYLNYELLDDNLPVFSTIGICGELTGWGSDIDMTPVGGVNHSWYTTLTLTEKTELKFRANHDWTVNWGATNFPYGQAIQDGANIRVEAGNYVVFFNDITGDYLFLDAATGELPAEGQEHIVDGMYLNTDYAMIDARDITFNTDDAETTVQVVDAASQEIASVYLLLENNKIQVAADGTVNKQQLANIISKMSNRQVGFDASNNRQTTTVQALLRGYCDKNGVRVYTESKPFNIVKVEEKYHLADAYYYVGSLNAWDPSDKSMPFVKEQEGKFRFTFIQPAGMDHWFKAAPSSTIDWEGDFVCPANSEAGVGSGLFVVANDGNTWHIPSADVDKTYSIVFDFATMNYLLSEGDFTGINTIDIPSLTTDDYYTIDGRKTKNQPSKKGVYIVGGKKVVIR